jgi:hypothetical protein
MFTNTKDLNAWLERKTKVNSAFTLNSISYQAVPLSGGVMDRILVSYHISKNEYGVYEDID